MFPDDRGRSVQSQPRHLILAGNQTWRRGLPTVHLSLEYSEFIEKKTHFGSKEDVWEIVLAIIEKRKPKTQTLGKCWKQMCI